MQKPEKTVNQADIQKFMSMELSKRDRIINAAMHEFRYGYKKASTDAIVQKAEISKGLLFHYFGSKEQLYAFLVNYAIEMVNSEILEMIDTEQRDLLESIWQMALLQRDISNRHPSIYVFLNGVYAHRADIPNNEIAEMIMQKQEDALDEYYYRCDTGLLVDNIDSKKIIRLMLWAIAGFLEEEEVKNQDYEDFLKDLRSYLDIFRLRFYKKQDKSIKL